MSYVHTSFTLLDARCLHCACANNYENIIMLENSSIAGVVLGGALGGALTHTSVGTMPIILRMRVAQLKHYSSNISVILIRLGYNLANLSKATSRSMGIS